MSADPLFKVNALLAVPAGLSDAELKRELEALATEMMVDFELEPARRRRRADLEKRTGPRGPRRHCSGKADQAENDEPQPQVDWAFGFLITNCAPSSPSWKSISAPTRYW